MTRMLRWLAIFIGLLVLALGVGLGLLYSAATVVPAEYEQALRVDEDQQVANRKELETELATLYTDAQDTEAWQTVLTADQINGWLATQLPQDYPELAEQGLTQPRVIFSPAGATLAIRVSQGRLNGVATAQLQSFLAEDGRLAVQLLSLKLGRVPLPMGQLVEQLRTLLADSQQSNHPSPVQWTQSEGLPVLLVDFEQIASDDDAERWLTGIEIREGEVALAGATRLPADSALGSPEELEGIEPPADPTVPLATPAER